MAALWIMMGIIFSITAAVPITVLLILNLKLNRELEELKNEQI